MKILLVLAVAVVACTAVSVLPKRDSKHMDLLNFLMESKDDVELIADEEGDVEISPQNIILKWQMNRFMRKFQKKMPCGFPEYGVPPLAPVRLNDAQVNLEKGPISTFDDFYHLRIDNLDNFKFKSLKLNVLFKRIKFDLSFPNVKASSPKYLTNTVLDELEKLGISVRIEAEDKFSFGVKNLRIVGTLIYDMPILWGSNKIKSLKTTTKVEKINSEIDGILGHGKLNHAMNTFIETFIEEKIDEMSEEISDVIENAIVPPVNKQLKGTDFWDILEMILNAIDGEKEDDPIIVNCVPPPDPWA